MIAGFETRFVDNSDGQGYSLDAGCTCLVGLADSSDRVPLVDGIPRFVSADNYAASFGEQWHRYADVQIDSLTGVSTSSQRLFECSGWSPDELKSKTVLEVGCGAGRFTEVLLSAGATVCAIDFSNSVEVTQTNNIQHADRLCLAQADIYDIPFPPQSFDFVFCFGVLQHTPDPHRAFLNLTRYIAPGGKIAVDCYLRDGKIQPWKSKYLWRWLTTRVPRKLLFRAVEWYVPKWLLIDDLLRRIPYSGPLRSIVPCFNWGGHGIPKEQVERRSVLDTFDALSAAYDLPQTPEDLWRWLREAHLEDPEVFNGANGLVARGRQASIRRI